MKIYNKGERLFTFHDFNIKPGMNEVPEKYEAEPFKTDLAKVVADYPTELIAGDQFSVQSKAKDAVIAAKDVEIAELKTRLANMQKLVSAEGAQGGSDLATETEEKTDAAAAPIAPATPPAPVAPAAEGKPGKPRR